MEIGTDLGSHLSLFLVMADEFPPAGPAERRTRAGMPNPPLILFIDDSDEDREYFAQRLQICSPDLLIVPATTGQSGLDIHQRLPIDCVVLETDLPDRAGFEVLVKLVPRVSHPDTAVVVLTRIANRFLWAAALKNGAQAALYKPMTSGDILYKAILKAIATVSKSLKSEDNP
jgi:PleD family two-component response regulator